MVPSYCLCTCLAALTEFWRGNVCVAELCVFSTTVSVVHDMLSCQSKLLVRGLHVRNAYGDMTPLLCTGCFSRGAHRIFFQRRAIGSGRGQWLGGGTMASAEHEPITGVWGQSPQRRPGAEPLVSILKSFWSLDVQLSRQI